MQANKKGNLRMTICPAIHFDIQKIMITERQSFIPKIQEKKRVFEKRLKIFPEGFLILSDSSEETLKEFGTAQTVGYFSSELWDELPDFSDEKRTLKRFSLGHDPLTTHKTNGKILYVSSFAINRDYRKKGNGKTFFENSVSAICGQFPQIKQILILVNSEWTPAIKIYEGAGFKKILTLSNFFPTLIKKEYSDGIIMVADAEAFKSHNFEQNENPFGGIQI